MKFAIHHTPRGVAIEHGRYPRWIGRVTFDTSLSDITDVIYLDTNVDPLVLARSMREAGEFLLLHKENITQKKLLSMKKPYSFKFDESIIEKARQQAQKERRSLTSFIELAILAYLKIND